MKRHRLRRVLPRFPPMLVALGHNSNNKDFAAESFVVVERRQWVQFIDTLDEAQTAAHCQAVVVDGPKRGG